MLSLSFTNNPEKRVIVIDVGHSGQDKDTQRDDLVEKDIVLDIAKKIKAMNKDENLEIILTRGSDTYPTLSDRTSFINELNPEMTISLHINSAYKNNKKKDSEIYYQDNENSKKITNALAEKLGNCLTKTMNLHILNKSTNPAIMLELGYLSNEDDRKKLSSEEGKVAFAEKILAFLQKN